MLFAVRSCSRRTDCVLRLEGITDWHPLAHFLAYATQSCTPSTLPKLACSSQKCESRTQVTFLHLKLQLVSGTVVTLEKLKKSGTKNTDIFIKTDGIQT